MKKIFLLLAVSALFVACSKEVDEPIVSNEGSRSAISAMTDSVCPFGHPNCPGIHDGACQGGNCPGNHDGACQGGKHDNDHNGGNHNGGACQGGNCPGNHDGACQGGNHDNDHNDGNHNGEGHNGGNKHGNGHK